ncbi:MAG: methionyl-tRNA formyltransferase [Rudaea sp.]
MPVPLRLVFAGTPEFAVPHLAACLSENVEIAAVYTQPDRPAGRGRALAASPVKRAALGAGLSVEQPQTLKSEAVRDHLCALHPDLLVVVAYGLILPRKLLAIPRLGCWNVHASLLPRWRGAAPIQRAILAGDTRTGVCLMQMQAGLDTGPILLQRELSIAPTDTGGILHDKLATLGATLLGEGLRCVRNDESLPAQAQPETGVTYAHKLDKAEARLDFAQPAIELERKVRAFDPWPVAEAQIGGERLRIWSAQALPASNASHSARPGVILAASKHGIDIACGDGVLRIVQMQRDGGRRLSIADYLNARPQLATP